MASQPDRRKAVGHRVGTVYLLHFSRPYHHARHYLGFSTELGKRFGDHSGWARIGSRDCGDAGWDRGLCGPRLGTGNRRLRAPRAPQPVGSPDMPDLQGPSCFAMVLALRRRDGAGFKHQARAEAAAGTAVATWKRSVCSFRCGGTNVISRLSTLFVAAIWRPFVPLCTITVVAIGIARLYVRYIDHHPSEQAEIAINVLIGGLCLLALLYRIARPILEDMAIARMTRSAPTSQGSAWWAMADAGMLATPVRSAASGSYLAERTTGGGRSYATRGTRIS